MTIGEEMAISVGRKRLGEKLLRLAAPFKAGFCSVPHVSSVLVEQVGELPDFLKRGVRQISGSCAACGLQGCVRCGSEGQPEIFCGTGFEYFDGIFPVVIESGV